MMAVQTAKGPDEAATSVQAGVQSISPSQDQKMNSTEHNTGPAVAPVSLTEAIRLYKRSLAEFNFRTFDVQDDEWDDLVPLTYGPHLDTLSNWSTEATSAEEAREALRITLTDDGGIYGCDAACECMIKAAYGYLKGIAA